MKSLSMLVGFLALVAVAAAFGALYRPGPWYEGLERPPLSPPNWIFGPVWTMLYIGIAVAAWRIWRSRPPTKHPLVFWGIQLVLNALWSLLFFGLHRPGLALVDIGVLWVVIVITTRLFFRQDRLAGWLFVPYVAWVSFATYLNAGFVWLNN